MKIVALTILLVGVLCTIKITEPSANPFPKSQLTYSIANFGDIPYGKTITGELELYESQPDLCSTDQPVSHSNSILLTLRGNCTFVTKAENAQKLGAKMLLIADNVDEKQKIVMADDGRGRLISIPSLFINYEDGTRLTEMLRKNTTVKILMKLEVNVTKVAEIRFWLSASSRQTYILMREFKPYYDKLKDYLKLNVSYYSHECDGCPLSDCFQQNTSYCQIDGIYHQPGSGQLIIEEQFMQYALFKSNPQKWFQYLDEFDKQCIDWKDSRYCGEEILHSMQLYAQVSGSAEKLNKTKLLETWADEFTTGGVTTVPDATINGVYYRGTVDAQDIAEMACASLKTRPSGCSEFFEVEPSSASTATIVLAVFTSIIIAVLVVGLIILIYRRTVKKEITNEMSTKVTEMVTKYASLVSEHERKGKEREIERSREDL